MMMMMMITMRNNFVFTRKNRSVYRRRTPGGHAAREQQQQRRDQTATDSPVVRVPFHPGTVGDRRVRTHPRRQTVQMNGSLILHSARALVSTI
jgi:hypothetical protein